MKEASQLHFAAAAKDSPCGRNTGKAKGSGTWKAQTKGEAKGGFHGTTPTAH